MTVYIPHVLRPDYVPPPPPSCGQCAFFVARTPPAPDTAESYSWPLSGLGDCVRYPQTIAKNGDHRCGEFQRA